MTKPDSTLFPARVVKYKTGRWWHIVAPDGVHTRCRLTVGFRDNKATATTPPADTCPHCLEDDDA